MRPRIKVGLRRPVRHAEQSPSLAAAATAATRSKLVMSRRSNVCNSNSLFIRTHQ